MTATETGQDVAAAWAPRPLSSVGRRIGGHLPVVPGLVLLGLFAVLPLAALAWTGFTENTGSGLTLAHFDQALTSPVYLSLLGRTLWVAFGVTVISIAVGWPAAWALAKLVDQRRRNMLLGLVVIPYITSQLLLIYAMLVLVQVRGPLMTVLHGAHLAGEQSSIAYTPTATWVMLIYESVPTAVLVMYSAAERIDVQMLDAARSLGASRWRVFGHVIWPLSSTILAANFTLTFVQTVGAFAESAVLGGPNGQLLGNAIAEQISDGGSRAFAVALSLVLLLASLIVVGFVAGVLSLFRRPRRTPGLSAAVGRLTPVPAGGEGS